VFNALARLSDEQQVAVPDGEPAPDPGPEPAIPAQEERTDLSPLEEALAHPEQGETPDLPATAEESVSEDALEFDPETTDVGAVFVDPPPNPQWTAATGSFKAMRAASEEPTPEESTASASGESQLDVEIDAAFLAEILREPAPAASEAPPSEPALPKPQRAPPALQHRAPPSRPAAPPAPPPVQPPAPPPARASRDSGPERGAAAVAAARRAALPGTSPRAAAPHAASHARSPAEASPRERPAATRGREPPAREERAFQAPEEAISATLDLDADETTAADDDDAADRPRLSRLRPHTWAAGAALALVVLLAQIVNHYRDELAATARFNRPLTTLYASVGVKLVPHWDPRAYDVRQLGAAADPAGSGLITLRASIKNSGREPQPLPLLRVTLQDRFGNRIAARDVAPRFYVPRTMPESSYLAGGQRIDAEMGFVDPGANAVGFEIDACLPASGGGITCANDLATR
jgi:hypothetical protein